MDIIKHQVFYFCKQDMIFVFLRDLVVCKLNKRLYFLKRDFLLLWKENDPCNKKKAPRV
jgi:hypothetical protein